MQWSLARDRLDKHLKLVHLVGELICSYYLNCLHRSCRTQGSSQKCGVLLAEPATWVSAISRHRWSTLCTLLNRTIRTSVMRWSRASGVWRRSAFARSTAHQKHCMHPTSPSSYGDDITDKMNSWTSFTGSGSTLDVDLASIFICWLIKRWTELSALFSVLRNLLRGIMLELIPLRTGEQFSFSANIGRFYERLIFLFFCIDYFNCII